MNFFDQKVLGMEKMKLLFLFPDEKNTIFNLYVDQLSLAGYSVTSYDYNKFALGFGLKKMRDEVKKLSSEHDLTVVSFYEYTFALLTPEFLGLLNKQTIIILFSFDDEMHIDKSINYCFALDAVITTDYWGRGLFELANVPTIYFPFFRPINLERNPKIPKDIDVSFVGNLDVADRRDYINFLRCNGINVEVFGSNSKNGPISKDDYILIMRRTKINLNFTKPNLPKDILNRYPWRARVRQLKGRPFEIANCESFCLSEFSPTMHVAFPGNAKLQTFQNKEELLYKILFYLQNEYERELSAKMTSDFVRQEYKMPETISKLMSSTLDIINKSSGVKNYQPKFKNSKEFAINLCTSNIIYVLMSIRKGKFQIGFEFLREFISLKPLLLPSVNSLLQIASVLNLKRKRSHVREC